MNGTDVTNSHEPSYYEIALTNRQVVVAFIILLVCLLSAFFSGVWIGRESAARTAEKLAANGAPAPQEPKEGRSLEEFQFFDKPQAKGETPAEPTPQTHATPRQDTTLLEDMSGDEGDDVPPMDEEAGAGGGQAREGQAGAAAAGDHPPQTAAERKAERQRQRQAEKQAAAAAGGAVGASGEDTVRPRPLPEATPTPPASGKTAGQVVIQVFSSPEKDQAERIQQRLAGGGQRAFLSPVTVGGRTMYRVRIGPFTSRDEAQKVAEQVRKGYKLDTWVTE